MDGRKTYLYIYIYVILVWEECRWKDLPIYVIIVRRPIYVQRMCVVYARHTLYTQILSLQSRGAAPMGYTKPLL